MKRFVFLALALFLSLLSCKKEDAKEGGRGSKVVPVGNRYQITASVQSLSTKAAPKQDSYQVVWQSGDQIGLVDPDGVVTPATLDESSAGSASGSFSYYASEPVSVQYAFYPYTGNETLRGTVLSHSLPVSQALAREGMMTDSRGILMTAKPSGGVLCFTNACAIVEFRIKGPSCTLRQMTLTNGRAMAGKGTIDLSDDRPVFSCNSTVKELTVELGELAVSPSSTSSVYVILPEDDYDDLGLKFMGVGTDGVTSVSFNYPVTDIISLTAGHIRPLVLTLEEDTPSLYGQVLCEGNPVPGVVVSDGHLLTRTDESGNWQLASNKKEGLVYISIPSGYTVDAGYGAIPEFWRATRHSASTLERIDFQLQHQENQENHRVYLLGDMHGMYKNNAPAQFDWFASNLNAQVAKTTIPQVGIQLGDNTWDYIWYDSATPFRMSDYLEWSKDFEIPVFNCMGNHDGDMYLTDDWQYGRDFREHFGPTYYSFNMGKVHYVVLDNVITHNDGSGMSGRHYNFGHSADQLAWLKADLSFVPATTPVVVFYHIPMLNRRGTAANSSSGDMNLADFIAPFSSFSDVRYYAAHTHNLYSASATVSGKKVTEQNVHAVCADFWISGGEDSRLLIGRDGTPAGFRVLDVNGTSFKDVFHPTGRENYLFRAYDRNNIYLTADEFVPEAGPNHKAAWQNILGEFASRSSANYVYIYTWDWKDDWQLSVTENGNRLSATVISATDPIYMISRTVINRCNKPDSGSYSLDMAPMEVTKVFRVKASSANSTLIIRMTDSYGNSRTEVMKRPKDFSLAVYAAEGFPSAGPVTEFFTPNFDYDEAMDL